MVGKISVPNRGPSAQIIAKDTMRYATTTPRRKRMIRANILS